MDDMYDFGGDASNGKCQVRSKNQDCPHLAAYRLEVNPLTDRRVCERCLRTALWFALNKGHSHAVVVSRLKKEIANV